MIGKQKVSYLIDTFELDDSYIGKEFIEGVRNDSERK